MDNVVVRMGTFHMVMSTVGSIFEPMKGSGIEEAMQCIYGTETIAHIMSGKAIARAMRAIHLLQAALVQKLLQRTLCDAVDDLCDLLMTVYNGTGDSLDSVLSSTQLLALETELRNEKERLSVSRTSKLWLQFLDHAETLNVFVAFERLKNWEGHLNILPSLLTIFAATGHLHYAKSGRMYLQEMLDLPRKHPDLYSLYTEHGMHVVQRTGHPFNGLSTDLVIEQVLMRSLKTRGGLTHGRGMTDSIRLQWVYAMPHLVAVHNAMTGLTGKERSGFEHQELGSARRRRDTADLLKLVQWFEDNDPFDIEVSALRSLSSGLTAENGDGINCDDVASVGHAIQQSLDFSTVADAKIKRKSKIKTLNDLEPAVKVGEKSFHVDPMTLFLRCVSIAQRLDEDVEQYFEYELNLTPPALFDGHFMRHTQKSDLANTLLKDLGGEIGQHVTRTVIDGGWLMNYVRWEKGSTYMTVINQYKSFVMRFESPIVVFDGYTKSTKDHEHSRRLMGTKKRTNRISIKMNAPAPDQAQFLANVDNKAELIISLERCLNEAGVSTKCCVADADTTIVSSALGYAREGASVRIVANDTDILIVLIHHWDETMADIFLRRPSAKAGLNEYNIRDIVASVDPVVKRHILFAHAWSGCDTTSATYGQGKTAILKRLIADEKVRILSESISDSNDVPKDVAMAGQKLFVRLYGGGDQANLASLRLNRFKQMMVQSNSVRVASLPPSTNASGLHAMRVHLQVAEWQFRTLDPLNWGWEHDSDQGFRPIPTQLPPAPENVLKYIRCKCKSVKNQCGTNLCSCRKNGMKCVDVCGGCHGEGCQNSAELDLDD